jgi:hypothetical protein
LLLIGDRLFQLTLTHREEILRKMRRGSCERKKQYDNMTATFTAWKMNQTTNKESKSTRTTDNGLQRRENKIGDLNKKTC